MPPSFVMIDDFVANPRELRRQALALGYDPAGIRRVPQRWPEHGPGSDRFVGACP